MKRQLFLLLLVVVMLFCASCAPAGEGSIWDNATYKTDATVGEGEKTVSVEIVAEEKSVILTIKTDEENLGSALFALELTNDASFFDTINGMTASWEKDKAYWCFMVDDVPANYGVADQIISDGESYKIVYTK